MPESPHLGRLDGRPSAAKDLVQIHRSKQPGDSNLQALLLGREHGTLCIKHAGIITGTLPITHRRQGEGSPCFLQALVSQGLLLAVTIDIGQGLFHFPQGGQHRLSIALQPLGLQRLGKRDLLAQ